MNGKLTSIVRPVSRTVGRRSTMSRRSGGNASFSRASAGRAAWIVRGSSPIAVSRLVDSRAKAPAAVLKSVTSPRSASGLRLSPRANRPALST
jgi:hypothetical protein